MSERILKRDAVTENGVALTPFERRSKMILLGVRISHAVIILLRRIDFTRQQKRRARFPQNSRHLLFCLAR